MLETSEGRRVESTFTQPLLFCADIQTPSMFWGRTGGVVGLVNMDVETDSIKKAGVRGICSFPKLLEQRKV